MQVQEIDQAGAGAVAQSRATKLMGASEDLERRREIGQFFTPPVVAGFVWDMLEIIHGAKFSKRTRVIDPACGEGVFLRIAAGRIGIAADCLFGADIDEALAAEWRSDAHFKNMHLVVGNGLLDQPARGLRAASFDLVVGNPPFAGNGVRDLLRLLDEADAATAMPETDLFGALVLQERSAPVGPPLTPHERAELDQLAKALGRFHCWRLSKESPEDREAEADGENGSTELFAADLGRRNGRSNGSGEFDKAAEMVAAWPPNRPLDPKRPETRLLLRRLASTAIEVFFMERFAQLAKPGGLIAVIVPESIVASDQLGPLRTWLLTQMQLLAVVSLPQKVFVGVGANAKTSIVFARRRLHPEAAGTQPPPAPAADEEDGAKTSPNRSKVLMAAPEFGGVDLSLEEYLSTLLQRVRGNPKRFSSEPA